MGIMAEWNIEIMTQCWVHGIRAERRAEWFESISDLMLT